MSEGEEERDLLAEDVARRVQWSKGGRQVLGDACYDFYARDGFDGALYGPFDHSAAATRKVNALRRLLPAYERTRIHLVRALNEKKIRSLLMRQDRE